MIAYKVQGTLALLKDLHDAQEQRVPWQSDERTDMPAAASESEDASDSDPDTFTRDDLFGEAGSEADDEDSHDEEGLRSGSGDPSFMSDPGFSRLQETAADLMDQLMGVRYTKCLPRVIRRIGLLKQPAGTSPRRK